MKRRRYPAIEHDIIALLERKGALRFCDIWPSLPYPLDDQDSAIDRLEKVGAIAKKGKLYCLSAPPPPPHTPISQNDREGHLPEH